MRINRYFSPRRRYILITTICSAGPYKQASKVIERKRILSEWSVLAARRNIYYAITTRALVCVCVYVSEGGKGRKSGGVNPLM